MARIAATLTVLAALTMAPNHSRAITFADGQVHVIDAENSFPFDDVVVADGPNGSFTTVTIAEGGSAASCSGCTIRLHGSSRINMFGGTAYEVYLNETSEFSTTGGTISNALRPAHESMAEISGGVISSIIAPGGSTSISGGNVNELSPQGVSVAVVRGGIVPRLRLEDSGYAEILGALSAKLLRSRTRRC